MSTSGLRPSRRPILTASLALCLGLSLIACGDTGDAGHVQLASAGNTPVGTPGGSSGALLYVQGLDDIATLYLEPVSIRKVALSGAARLSRIDPGIGVNDSFGAGFGSAWSLSYNGRDIGFFAPPAAESDHRKWGELLASVVASAKQVSPRLTASSQEVIDKVIFEGMTAALDRFSRYSDPDVARDQRADRNGFGGVGITFDNAGDVSRVTAITPHGPADNAGIRPEDHILAIDNVATAGQTHEEIVHRLRGAIGSPIALRVQRPGATAQDMRLHRALVASASVSLTREGGIAVFKVTAFNKQTTDRVAEGLAELQKPGAPPLGGIVLDLRNNPGGILEQAVSLADLFIPKGPIVSATGRHPASHQSFAATGRAREPKVPMAVLINGASASSAEIVASALQDTGRAVVLGSSSYGKGTVQTVMRMANDGELILTWARLVTPAGYRLNRHGVVPTVCTAGIQNGAAPRVTALGGSRPRSSLDDDAWVELRNACPPLASSPPGDLKLATQLLVDAKLYADALHSLPSGGPQQTASAPPAPVPALTGSNRTLSFETR